MTISALLLARPVIRLQPSPRLSTRRSDYCSSTCRSAARSRTLPRRHGAHGRPHVGLGHRVCGWARLRLGDRCLAILGVERDLTCSCSDTSLAPWPSGARVPDVELNPKHDGHHGPAPSLLPVPAWLTTVHLLFHGMDRGHNSHYPGLFLAGFLFFLGFAKATAVFQSPHRSQGAAAGRLLPRRAGDSRGVARKAGGSPRCWPALERTRCFFSSTVLTAFNDNALDPTYLATLVPGFERAAGRSRSSRVR